MYAFCQFTQSTHLASGVSVCGYPIFLYRTYIHIYNSLPDSSVNTVTKYWTTDESGGKEMLLFIPCPHRFSLHPDSCGPFLWGKASTVSSESLPSKAEVKKARSYAYFFRVSWFVKYWGECTFPFILRKHSSLLMYCAELVAVADI